MGSATREGTRLVSVVLGAGSEAARRDLVAQQIGELAENRAVGRRIDHDFYGTWS